MKNNGREGVEKVPVVCYNDSDGNVTPTTAK